jgi:hypothetical protein
VNILEVPRDWDVGSTISAQVGSGGIDWIQGNQTFPVLKLNVRLLLSLDRSHGQILVEVVEILVYG